VKLTVGAFAWSAVEVSLADVEAWWRAHCPPAAVVPAPDLSRTDMLDVDTVGVGDVAAVGGKAANYGELRKLARSNEAVRVRPGLVVPVARYAQFMDANGFAAEVAAKLADPTFQGDGNERRRALADLQARMLAAPVDAAFLAALEARITTAFPATRMKFRSSTNAEDLAHHTGAGLYDSKAGQPGDPKATVADAVRFVWASTWNFRAFEERATSGIDHAKVAMAVLVVPSYTDEAANGVALTANLYDPGPTGEDAFYVNAQLGETSVVQPDPHVVADQLLYFYFHNGAPATYLAHSTLVAAGQTVLSRDDLFELGAALAAVREHFTGLYDAPAGVASLPMDVEWKVVAENGARHVWLKQARPYPGRGETTETGP
jgi:phosphoenolpyruvate synthase/pyruvate phosphate dikinase